VVDRFHLDAEPPRAEVSFSGRGTERDEFRLQGSFAGTNFLYREAFVESAEVDVAVSGRVVRLEGLDARTASGRVQGDIGLDFAERRVDVDLISTANPHQGALAVGSRIVTGILRPFDFRGPADVVAQGSIHIAEPTKSHLDLTLAAERVALKEWEADAVSFVVAWTNRTVEIDDLKVDIYDGGLSGELTFHLPPWRSAEPVRYDLHLGVETVQFERVVRTLLHKEGEPYHGILGGTVNLSGELGPGAGASLQGDGVVEIRDGRIMQIPVFVGLSSILGRLYHGLGMTRQTAFRTDYRVRAMDVQMENLQIEGDVYSLRADGHYTMNSKELDFDVEFQLLRDGVVGTVVRLVTRPLTKLLEFDLEGSVDDPRWRPKNLPKELWGTSG
jgi:hypothetical protein